MCKKEILLSLLCLFCCFHLSAQTSPVQSNLTNLEDYVINLENESLTQKILINNLEEQLNNANQSVENLNNQLIEILAQQEMQSKLLKKYEFKCKVLKVSLVVGIPIAITTTGILCYYLNNK